jgi:hypothetical protein
VSGEYFLFVDDSGDLGRYTDGGGSSRYFLLGALGTANKRALEKCVKKVHDPLQKKRKKHMGVLHACREKDVTRKKLLLLLAERECEVFAVIVDKKKRSVPGDKLSLYAEVLLRLLKLCLKERKASVVHVVLSRPGTGKAIRERFVSLVTQWAAQNGTTLNVSVRGLEEEKGLQAVDFVSWAFFRKYEHQEDGYYQIFQKNVVEETLVP